MGTSGLHSDVSVVNFDQESESNEMIVATIIHEMGHSLGLDHSDVEK